MGKLSLHNKKETPIRKRVRKKMRKYLIANLQILSLFIIFLYFVKEDSAMLIINGVLYYIIINIQPFFEYDFDTFLKFVFLYFWIALFLFYIIEKENAGWRCFILVGIWFISSIFIKNLYLFEVI